MDQGEFYVYSPDGALEGVDTIRLQGGRFNYEMVCESPKTLVIVFPNYSEQPIFAEPGKDVKLQGDASHLKELTVKGTKANELMNTFREQILNTSPPREVAIAEQFIKDNPQSVVSLYLLRRYFIAGSRPNYEKALQLCKLLKKQQPENVLLGQLQQQMAQLSHVREGKRMPQFTATDVQGNKVNNATLGKGLAVIMVSATWSYDAQRMVQDIRQLAKKSKGRLKVVSISIDPNPRQCRANAARDSITWPMICDGKMLESPLLHTLSLFNVPDNILINNGNVIAKGLRNDELKQRIERML